MKIEFYDTDGVRHSITIDGPATREKVARILDLVEVISGNSLPSLSELRTSTNKLDKLTSSILTDLSNRTFRSTDAKRTFETTYNEKIPLSTVSTYLSRLVDRGLLQRHPDATGLGYTVTPGPRRPLETRPSSLQASGSLPGSDRPGSI